MISRRKFLQAGAAIAITAGLPLKSAVVSVIGRSSTPQESLTNNRAAQTSPTVKSDVLVPFSKASFAAYLNSTFLIKSIRTKAVEVKLVEVNDAGPVPDQHLPGKECFALLFRGLQRLPQDVYKIEHAALGKFDLLLVPMARDKKDKKGLYYEALINRLN